MYVSLWIHHLHIPELSSYPLASSGSLIASGFDTFSADIDKFTPFKGKKREQSKQVKRLIDLTEESKKVSSNLNAVKKMKHLFEMEDENYCKIKSKEEKPLADEQRLKLLNHQKSWLKLQINVQENAEARIEVNQEEERRDDEDR